VRVTHGATAWSLSAEDDKDPDPVTAFLGALGGCLLMSLRIAARGRNAHIGRASITARCNEKGHVKEVAVELRVASDEPDDKLRRLVEVAERGYNHGYVGGELSWTLEDNVLINRGIERMGARKYKTWRVYEKPL